MVKIKFIFSHYRPSEALAIGERCQIIYCLHFQGKKNCFYPEDVYLQLLIRNVLHQLLQFRSASFSLTMEISHQFNTYEHKTHRQTRK
jgi:hypothetical protein